MGSSIPEKATESPTAEQKLEIEQAKHIGHLLAAMSAPLGAGPIFTADIKSFHQGVERLIGDMDGGVAAHFAKRLGIRKSTVHYWQTGRTLLTLDAAVRMAMHCGVSLPSLLQGELSDWCPPPTTQQLALQLDYPASNRHRPKRQHDWSAIRQQLRDELNQTKPRSVTEVAKALNMDVRHLYIQATAEARALGKYYVQHMHQRALQTQAAIHAELLQACEVLHENGESITVEQVAQLVEHRTLNSARHLYTVLSSLAGQAANDAAM